MIAVFGLNEKKPSRKFTRVAIFRGNGDVFDIRQLTAGNHTVKFKTRKIKIGANFGKMFPIS